MLDGLGRFNDCLLVEFRAASAGRLIGVGREMGQGPDERCAAGER